MKFEIRQPNPALRFTSTPQRRTRTNRIILHHYHHERATPQDVHRWHLDRGWIGNGYNFSVDMDGTIWEIRGHGAVGTHTANNNGDSIGIACQGRYDDSTQAMPDAQFNALVWLIKFLRGIYGDIAVIGHRDASPSACPGRHFPLAEVQRLQFRGNITPPAPPQNSPPIEVETMPTRTVALDIMGSVQDVGGYIENGATFVRLTDFAAALGFAVKWDSERRLPVVYDNHGCKACGAPTGADKALEALPELTTVDEMELTAADDVRLLNSITHWEARGEDDKGQILITNVIKNRMASPNFPNSIRDVIFAPGAFTPSTRPDFDAAQISERTAAAVSKALSGVDYSQGATFFHSLRGITPDVWHERATREGRLVHLFDHGGHRFYKES